MEVFVKNFNRLYRDAGKGDLEIPGFSPDRIKEMLVGSVFPRPSELVRIADFFGVSLDVLMRPYAQENLRLRLREIRFLCLDVDGVMTDGGMYYSESGDELKKFNTKDGMAIKRLIEKGFMVGFLSSSIRKKVVQNRAKALGVNMVYVGTDEKRLVLQQWLEDLGLSWSQVAYIGDDVNDLSIMERVGIAACPADAVRAIKAVAAIQLVQPGGKGCVREFADEWLGWS